MVELLAMPTAVAVANVPFQVPVLSGLRGRSLQGRKTRKIRGRGPGGNRVQLFLILNN